MAENETLKEKKLINFKKDELFEAMMCETCMKMCTDYCCTGNISKSERLKPNTRAMVPFLHNNDIKSYDEAGIDAIYYCTLCEGCETHCRPHVNTPNLIKKARAQIVDLELAPESIRKLGMNVLNSNNSLNEVYENRFEKLKDVIPKKDKAEIVYFVGCVSTYREFEIARATLNLLKKGNFDFCILNEEFCCGSPILNTGNVEIAENLIRHNIKKIKETGCSQIITSCSACYGMWKEEYPKYSEENFPFKIKHIIDFILDKIDEFNIKPYPKKVTYHDPCHLGRKLDIYNSPRELLQKIPQLEFIEMFLNKKDATCCGAGGGFRVYNKIKSLEIGSKRFEEALETKAEVLISACPLCKNQFKMVNIEDQLLIKDITELLDEVTD
ncbi:MAG: (Fe-S)-binding protein [Candidatus Lokiarchaeota archaeon]|nr:(Fe-S)-binding protein [Candidatus Lokiarchaeota archaeon]